MTAPLVLLAALLAQDAALPSGEVPDLRAWHAAIAAGDDRAATAFVAPDAVLSIYRYGRPVTATVADLVARLRPCTLVDPWSSATFRLRHQWGSIYQCPAQSGSLDYFLEMDVEEGRITGALLYADAVAMPAPRSAD